MFLWRVLELAFMAVVAATVITQMILPPFINKPLFWLFRKPERKRSQVKNALVDADTEIETAKMKKELARKRKKLS